MYAKHRHFFAWEMAVDVSGEITNTAKARTKGLEIKPGVKIITR
jgi:hypothetical protein